MGGGRPHNVQKLMALDGMKKKPTAIEKGKHLWEISTLMGPRPPPVGRWGPRGRQEDVGAVTEPVREVAGGGGHHRGLRGHPGGG